jgi:hypothetical protein
MAAFSSIALGIAAAASVAGAGIAAYGLYQQGKTSKRVAEFNAKSAENQAIQEDMDSRESARRERVHNRRLASRQRARIAKTGLVETGSPLEVMAEDAGRMELAVLDQRRNSRIKQSGLRSQAELTRAEGDAAFRAGRISAGASLLSGISSGFSIGSGIGG